MTTAERLQSIQASKEAIKAAIEAKGVECNDVLSTFAEKIAAIPTGGGSSEFSEYSYQVPTADEEGLRALGWDDDSIKQFKYNNLQHKWAIDLFKVTDENKALGDVIKDMSTLASKKYNANLIYCPLFDISHISNFTSMFSAYHTVRAFPLFNTSNGTNMTNMFRECTRIVSFPRFDTSKVVNMTYMFYNCKGLISVPLFDTSNVTNMYSMFEGCASLDYVPLFDTSNVTLISRMFMGCYSLKSIPPFNISQVTNTINMFAECTALDYVSVLDMSRVTDTAGMFTNCSSLTTLGGFTGLKADLRLSASPHLTHDSLMNIINEAADVTASPKTLTLGSTNLAKLTDEEKAVATGKGWTLA